MSSRQGGDSAVQAVESYLYTLADVAEFENIYKRKQVITVHKQSSQ